MKNKTEQYAADCKYTNESGLSGNTEVPYATAGKYLYEILEDYKTAATPTAQEEIFRAFCNTLWQNSNKRKAIKKTIRFSVRKDLLSTELGQIFDTWSEIEYTSCRSLSKAADYASLIRQKINNLYTHLCDKSICLKKEYLDLLRLPRTLYFQWINGSILEPDEVTSMIDDAIAKSIQVKEDFAKQKLPLSWTSFKKEAELCLRQVFDRYIPLEEYEDASQFQMESGLWQEDNYCISYFCNSLSGYFKNYQKRCYGLPQSTRHAYARCGYCRDLFLKKHNRQVYCPLCAESLKKARYRTYNQKRNHN